jgi:hypothetical protein
MTTLNTNNQDDNLDDLDKVILATSEIIKEAFNQIGETKIGKAIANKISIPADFAKIIEATEKDGFTGFVNEVGAIASGIAGGSASSVIIQLITLNPYAKVASIVAGSALSSDYYKDNIAPQVETLIDNIADGIDSVNNLVNEFIDSIQDPDGSSIPDGGDEYGDLEDYNQIEVDNTPSYDSWFNEKYKEWFKNEYDNWFDSYYKEWFENEFKDYFNTNHKDTIEDVYFEEYHNKYNEWKGDKYAKWYSQEYWDLEDQKYNEWEFDVYFDWYYNQYSEWQTDKYAEWYSEEYWDLEDQKYDEWEFDVYFDWYYDKYDEWSNDKYAEWYSEEHWDMYDQVYDDLYYEKYYDWQNEYEGEEIDYDDWYEEKYDEWFDEIYDEWFDEYFNDAFEDKYYDWFEDTYDEWFEDEYDTYFEEKYDIWFQDYFDDSFEDKYDTWFENKYDEWFEDEYDTYFEEKYDIWFQDYFDDSFGDKYDTWFEVEYNKWYNDYYNKEYNKTYDKKYDEWKGGKHNEWKSEKYDEWLDEKYNEWESEYDNIYEDSLVSYGSDNQDAFVINNTNQEGGNISVIENFSTTDDLIDVSNITSAHSISDITISDITNSGKNYTKLELANSDNIIYLEGIDSYSLDSNNFHFNNHKVINLSNMELTTNEDNTLTITTSDLIKNAIDFDNDTLTVENISLVGNDGILVDNGNGAWTLTPNENFSGELELNYQISDGYESTDAKANINVEAVADSAVISEVKQSSEYGLNSENANWEKIGYHKLVNSYENYSVKEGSSAVLLQTTTKSGVYGSKTYSSGIDNFLDLGNSSVKNVSSQATNGSAIKSNFIVNKGDTITFNYMFDTDDYQPYIDFATYSIGSEVYKLSSVADVGNFGNSGWKEVTIVAETSGSLGFAVLNLKDTAVNSSLLIDNVVINGGGNEVQAGEKYTLPLDIALADIDGSEEITIIIKGLPNSAILSQGSLLTNGYWQLTKEQYDNLEITFSEKNKTYDLVVDVITTETSNGDANTTSQNLSVKVTSSSSLTDLSFSVAEDNVLVIDKSVIANNIGVKNITITNINSENSITFIDENGNIRIIPDDNYSGLESITYTVVDGSSNSYNGTINVEVIARADNPLLLVETNDYVFDFASGTLDNWQTVGDVGVVSSYDGFNSADNDGYMARLSTGSGWWSSAVDQSVLEDFMGMDSGKLDTFNGNATNGSAMQTVIDVKAGDVISFEYIFSTNDYMMFNDFAVVKIGNDSFKLSDVSTVGDFGASDGWQKFQYVATSDGKLNFAVANLLDTWVSSSLMVDNVVISSNSTLEVASNSTLALPISAVLNDTDGSESLSIYVKNLPNEVMLNNGVKQADGSYLLTQDDLTNLQLITGDFSGHLDIEIEAISTESSNGDTSSSSKTLNIDVIQTGDNTNNTLEGNNGDNIISGLSGDDILIGNFGDDTLSGGTGSDTFVYKTIADGNDTITDFNTNESDKIDVSELLDYNSGDNLTDYISAISNDNDTIISIDANNDGTSDISITLADTTVSMQELIDNDSFIVM